MIRKGVQGIEEKPESKIKKDDQPKIQKDQISLRNIAELKSSSTNLQTRPKTQPEPSVENKKENLENVTKLYKTAYDYVIKNGETAKQGGKIDLKDGARIIAKMIKNPRGVEILYGKAINAKEDLDPIVSNMVNVAIYSIKIGIGLKYPNEKLLALGLAGLLHDFGMFKVPDSILHKTGKLTDQEFGEIKKHPIHGYEIIKLLGDKYIWLAEVLLQEHEREGGQGYPKKLKGDDIREYAKIVALADVFEGLTHKRPQRKKLLPYDATKKILAEARGLYATNVVKVLLQKLGCFPLESYVKLSSNAIAQVVDVNEKVPLRPTVELIFDPQGNKLNDKKIIKLYENTLVHIVESVYEEDLPQEEEL